MADSEDDYLIDFARRQRERSDAAWAQLSAQAARATEREQQASGDLRAALFPQFAPEAGDDGERTGDKEPDEAVVAGPDGG